MVDSTKLLANLYFGMATRESVYTKLAALTGNKVPLKESLALMVTRYERRKHPLRRVFQSMLHGLNSGQTLDQVFMPFVPGEEAMLIKSGLDSGDLPAALAQCAELLSARRKIVGSVWQAVSYPTMLFGMFLVMLVILSRYVMPNLAKLSNPDGWEPAARALYDVATFVDSPLGAAVLVLVVLSIAAAVFTMPYFTGPLRRHLDHLPPWSFYRLLVGSVWLYTVSAMLKSDIQLSTALTHMESASTTSAWLRERVAAIRAGLAHGMNFGTALDEAGHQFPDRELVEDILVYSKLPEFDERLHDIARQWLGSGIERIQQQARAINVLCIFGIVLLMSGVGLAVASLQQQMGSMPSY